MADVKARVKDKARRSSPGLIINSIPIPTSPEDGLLIRDAADNQLKILLEGIFNSIVTVESPSDGAIPQYDGNAKRWKKISLPPTVTLPIVEGINKFQAVYIDSNGNGRVADSSLSDGALVRVLGLAIQDSASGYTTVASNQVLSGFSGLVPGSIYYLGASGAISTTQSKVQIGIALSETDLKIEVHQLVRYYTQNFTAEDWTIEGSTAYLLVPHGLESKQVHTTVYDSSDRATSVDIQTYVNSVKLSVDKDSVFSGSINISLIGGPASGGSTGGGSAAGGKFYTETFGDGTSTTFLLNHHLGTQDLMITVREDVFPYTVVYPDMELRTMDSIYISVDDPTLKLKAILLAVE
jgi:hypothetical protein